MPCWFVGVGEKKKKKAFGPPRSMRAFERVPVPHTLTQPEGGLRLGAAECWTSITANKERLIDWPMAEHSIPSCFALSLFADVAVAFVCADVT